MTTSVQEEESLNCYTDCADRSLKEWSSSNCDAGKTGPLSTYLKATRWRVAYMGLLLGFMIYLLRINMNLVLPSMVKSTQHNTQASVNTSLYNASQLTSQFYSTSKLTSQMHNSTAIDADLYKNDVGTNDCTEVSGSQTSTLQGAEFSWNRRTQSVILSSYYYGLLVSQVPFSCVTGRLGGKHVISTAILVSAAVTLLLPFLARASVYAVIAVRIVLGISSGACLPAWYTLLSRWALPSERSRFTGIFWFGQYLGTILGFFTSGFLCAKGFDSGWGSVFYIHGIFGTLFVILWIYVIEEYPENHTKIGHKELQLLLSRSPGVDKAPNRKSANVPWLRMMTYVPVLAVIATHTLDCFVHYLVLICLPLYMKGVLKFDIQSNGVYTSLPFVCSAAGLFVSGYLADMVVSRKYLSATGTRKLFQVTALVGTAVFICLPGFLTCSQRGLVIMCLCVCMFFQALGYSSGYPASPVDIAPRYASVIYAVSNSFGTLSGILSPIAVTELTTHDTASEWRIVLFIAAGCAVIGAVVFGLFSSSALAPWAVDPDAEIEITVDKDDFSVTNDLKTRKTSGM